MKENQQDNKQRFKEEKDENNLVENWKASIACDADGGPPPSLLIRSPPAASRCPTRLLRSCGLPNR
nr:hypothetical protein Iba_chr04dCG15290 [Ipomoea batatas]GMD50110.1 hypothetical protein Iba_chr11aCG9530 [Ipomoea batatas]GME02140.1 hypothetical protein Iba_contig3953CG0020 [Ipomoea batatas]GME17373.1 hypothetical protein Iba_scaffold18636CG0010 [Ipomoea batatas]